MTRRRFYAPPEAFEENFVTLATEEARHLRDVLRLRVGDEAFVFDGEGREYLCLIAESLRNSARLEVREAVEAASPESPLSLTLAVALLKGEKFDFVVQKATELGVTRIMPVITKRADVRLRDASEPLRRVARWQRLALEACKQSGRARVPEIAVPISFPALLENDAIENTEARLMFAERSGQSLAEAFSPSDARPAALTALVGSEGGWEDEEIAQAANANWTIVTLGGRILRAETAAITVAALMQHLFGDLK
ncbi:MAG: 16S rRNA (uracil(1498)-N(3))-methyltransferase [Pyrinomonadaceae bacterium]|nr:16S rRNA (uracil(1498)-N(3))-methyltransferase [Pyrinomonadaceae bacterium]